MVVDYAMVSSGPIIPFRLKSCGISRTQTVKRDTVSYYRDVLCRHIV